MKKFLKSFLNICLWVICSIALTIAVNSWIQVQQGIQQPMIFGWGFAVVETGSMEPNVPTGSLIVIQDCDEYAVDDVITYVDYRGMSITHRIKSIEDGVVVTQGDANNTADVPFTEEAITGKVQLVVPKLGNLIKKIRTPGVIAFLAIILLASVVWDVIYGIVSKRKARAKTAVSSKSEATPEVVEEDYSSVNEGAEGI